VHEHCLAPHVDGSKIARLHGQALAMIHVHEHGRQLDEALERHFA